MVLQAKGGKSWRVRVLSSASSDIKGNLPYITETPRFPAEIAEITDLCIPATVLIRQNRHQYRPLLVKASYRFDSRV